MTKIRRKIFSTKVKFGFAITKNGKLELTGESDRTIVGVSLDAAQAHAMLSKDLRKSEKKRKEQLGEKYVPILGQLVITDVEYTEKNYEMSLDTFIANAKEIINE